MTINNLTVIKNNVKGIESSQKRLKTQVIF